MIERITTFDFQVDSHKYGTSEILDSKELKKSREYEVLELKRSAEAADRGVTVQVENMAENERKPFVSTTLDIVNDLYWCNNA